MIVEQITNKLIQVFISYSWDGEEHQQWVRELANSLISPRINVILDQYDLKAGDDKDHFMEQAVANATHVLVVCTPSYIERANDRQGGAGAETRLLTAKFSDRKQNGLCYIPIIRWPEQAPNKNNTPDYLANILYIDFSNDTNRPKQLEELQRRIYDAPKLEKPTDGSLPDFLQESGNEPKASSNINTWSTKPAEDLSITDLSIDGLKNEVLNSQPDEWQYNDDTGIFTYKADIRLQIRQKDYPDFDSFYEPWVERFADVKAYRNVHEIYYNDNLVTEYLQVLVDGLRMSLPAPMIGTQIVAQENIKFAKLIDKISNTSLYEFDQYFKQAKLTCLEE